MLHCHSERGIKAKVMLDAMHAHHVPAILCYLLVLQALERFACANAPKRILVWILRSRNARRPGCGVPCMYSHYSAWVGIIRLQLAINVYIALLNYRVRGKHHRGRAIAHDARRHGAWYVPLDTLPGLSKKEGEMRLRSDVRSDIRSDVKLDV